jgi:phage recombination protein Bet
VGRLFEEDDVSNALVRSSDSLPAQFDAEQVDLIKTQVMPGASNGELSLFMATCRRLQLDPFAKQIYAVKRWDSQSRGEKWVTQTGIDGFRVVANRSAEYEGQTGPHWCGEDGKWVDVWLDRKPPQAARVGVWRKGFREPTWGVATLSSYCQRKNDGTPMKQWASMPDVMLAKCAEALALRKAFPNDLSGIYTREEMQQAENDAVDVEAEPVAKSGPFVGVPADVVVMHRDPPREVDLPMADAGPLMAFDEVHEIMNRIPQLFGEAKKRERQVAYYQCFGHVGPCPARWNPGKVWQSLPQADREAVLARVKELAAKMADDLPDWGTATGAPEPAAREPGCDDA